MIIISIILSYWLTVEVNTQEGNQYQLLKTYHKLFIHINSHTPYAPALMSFNNMQTLAIIVPQPAGGIFTYTHNHVRKESCVPHSSCVPVQDQGTNTMFSPGINEYRYHEQRTKYSLIQTSDIPFIKDTL